MENDTGEITECCFILMSKNRINATMIATIKKEPGGSVLARLLSILVFTHTDAKFENM